MNCTRISLGTVSVLAIALLAPGPAAADILIGVAAPLSGRQASTARDVLRGVETAITAINGTSGGILGQKLVVQSEDDGCDANRARAIAGLLAAKKPAIVIGHPCAAAAMAAAPVYAKANIPFIAIGVRHPGLTDNRAGPGVFRLSGRDDRQGEAAAAALAAAAPGRRIAIVQDRTAYARSVLTGTTVALTKLGITPAPVLPIVAGKRDYDAEIARLVEVRPEAVLFAGYPSEAAVILRGMRKAGLAAVLVGSDALATTEFAEFVGEDDRSKARVQVLARTPHDTAAKGDADTAHGPHALFASAAVEAWADAAARAGSIDLDKIIAALTIAPVTTRALGVISFDAKGDASLPSYTAAVLVAGRWTAAPPSPR
jgi:branched-chain amino acid transport system substrate-binding protein